MSGNQPVGRPGVPGPADLSGHAAARPVRFGLDAPLAVLSGIVVALFGSGARQSRQGFAVELIALLLGSLGFVRLALRTGRARSRPSLPDLALGVGCLGVATAMGLSWPLGHLRGEYAAMLGISGVMLAAFGLIALGSGVRGWRRESGAVRARTDAPTSTVTPTPTELAGAPETGSVQTGPARTGPARTGPGQAGAGGPRPLVGREGTVLALGLISTLGAALLAIGFALLS